MSLQDVFQIYLDEQVPSYEGQRGISYLTSLVKVLGYRSLDAFFEDNSGAIEAIYNWIGDQQTPDWEQSIKDELVDQGVIDEDGEYVECE